MPIIHLLIGPSGCGKSTHAKQLEFNPRTVRLNADTMRGVISGDEGNQECSREAFGNLKMMCRYFMKLKYDIIIDNLNLTPKSRRQWLELLSEEKTPDYFVIAHVFWGATPEMCKERVKERAANGELSVPHHIIDGQFDAYWDLASDGKESCEDKLAAEFDGWLSEVDFVEVNP